MSPYIGVGHGTLVLPQYGAGLGTISDLAANPGDTQVTLTWTPAENATAHQPQYRQTGSSTWLDFGAPLAGDASQVVVTGLTNDIEHEFSVVASDDPPPGGVEPDFLEDFSTYTSTLDMIADPRNIYMDSEDQNTGQMALDQTEFYGDSDRSMRYTHTTGQTISRSFQVSPTVQEIWAEFALKFGAGVSNDWLVGQAYKIIHILTNTGNGSRFGWQFENMGSPGVAGSMNMESPVDGYDPGWLSLVSAVDVIDGQWHKMRYHCRIAAGNAFHEAWVDDVYKGSTEHALVVGTHEISQVIMGANMNESNGQTQNMWWGKLALWWTQDPGWAP